MTSACLTWEKTKKFYLEAWQAGQLETVILQQAQTYYGSLAKMTASGQLHQAGNFLVMQLPTANPDFSLTLFVHRYRSELSYLNLLNRSQNLIFRLPPLKSKTTTG
ncbi:MAG: hypothetical protein Q4G02_00385 [bacterium]|nr:hypothetical protein [bacterium]